MPHIAICGKSKSGKTTRATSLADVAIAARRRVIYVTSKSREREPFPCHWRTTDPFAALKILQQNKDITAFWDECWEYLTYDGDARPLLWLTNTSRGEGHQCVFIAQDFKRVHIAYRTNLEHLFLYRSPSDIAKQWAEDVQAPDLVRAAVIPRFNCMYWRDGFGKDGQPLPVRQLPPLTIK